MTGPAGSQPASRFELPFGRAGRDSEATSTGSGEFGPTALAEDRAWDRHLPLLAAEHHGWTFAPGLGRSGEGPGAI